MIHVSVLLPTHNPRADFLRRTVEALAAQTLPPDEWEVVIVDNASTRPVVVTELPVCPAALRIIREERLGLSFAREAGIAAARGPLLVFCDDDNILAPDYLSTARSFFAAHGEVGIAGGRILPEFETPPESWAKPHLGLLALRDLGSTTLISDHPNGKSMTYDYFAPFGAGMVVRAEAARRYAQWATESPARLVDRHGSSLGGCGDCELVLRTLHDGQQCAYLPALRVTHLIPTRRLTFSYLCRLSRESRDSWATFCRLRGLHPSIARWTVLLRQFKAFFTHRGWTRSGFIAWRGACGYFTGLAQ